MQLKQGMALLLALTFMVVVAGIIVLMSMRTINNLQNSRDNLAVTQSLMLARGGVQLGNSFISIPLTQAVGQIVNANLQTGAWSFGTSSSGANAPTGNSVATALRPVATQLQAIVNNALCNPIDLGNGGEVRLRLYFDATNPVACGTTLPSGVRLPSPRFVQGVPRQAGGDINTQVYALPFVLVSEGVSGIYRRNVVLQGEFHFDTGSGSFAQYALFTNNHVAPGGGLVWFTERTLFDGPVHTNGHFSFHGTPWFGDVVTSAGCTNPRADITGCDGTFIPGARFRRMPDGTGGASDQLIASTDWPDPMFPNLTNFDGVVHNPQFMANVTWNEEYIELPTNAFDQQQLAQDNGLLLPANLHSLTFWAGDLDGNTVAAGAQYQYIESCLAPGNCERYRYQDNGDLMRWDGTIWVVEQPSFNGVIFAQGEIERISGPGRNPAASLNPADALPAIASFAQITVAGNDQFRITGDLTYEIPPCTAGPTRNPDGTVTASVCPNPNANNIFGIYSANASVLIGNSNADTTMNAPDNVAIHATLMSGSEVVTVENFASGSPRGSVNLLGGVIQNQYGGFGTFTGTGGDPIVKSGYGRNFTYDPRMRFGMAPPAFPVIQNRNAALVTVKSFGQREQVQ